MRCFKSKKINETQKYVFKAKNSDSLFFWNKSTTQTCAVKSLKSKQFWYFWQGSSPNHLLFWKVFIFWSKIYKLPSGKHSDLFTQRKYSGEKFMTACQSDPWSSLGSPTSRMRKAPQCCWVMGVREEVVPDGHLSTAYDILSTLHCCLFTTSKAKTATDNQTSTFSKSACEREEPL